MGKGEMNDIKGIIEDVEKSSLVSDKVIKKIIEIIGQEKWQDINDRKSDICTTTGELIITLKGILELEKENAELKQKLTEKVTLESLDVVSARIDELEKENAELKQQIEQMKYRNCYRLV